MNDNITHEGSDIPNSSINTELLKHVAISFFYWWYNSKGNNTSQGFDEWIKLPSTIKAINEASKSHE